MKLGHQLLIWKNGRVPSNTYKRHPPLDLVSAVQGFLISSPKLLSEPRPTFFYITACSEVSKELRPLIHPPPDKLGSSYASFVFIASSGSQCTLERVCSCRHRDIQTSLIYPK